MAAAVVSRDGASTGLSKRMTKAATNKFQQFKDDMTVLRTIWFKPAAGNDHKERLDSFYGPQAHAYDRFRAAFLWGRRPMLAAVAARIRDDKDAVWVDMGGGTGENVAMMADYMPLSSFKKIIIVDLCSALCQVAAQKVKENGWDNVEVVEADACKFAPPNGEQASVVTFSYSLSMIPPFHAAVDQALSFLKPGGLLGVADFFVSGKYDLPLRQMSYLRRFFWRSIFDTDNIDLGPERRQYLDHKLVRVAEYNSEGSIPYVPLLRAPWYYWVGLKPREGEIIPLPAVEEKHDKPMLFPDTFLYSLSWEDPRTDEPVLQINENDVLLTLTSGGCNALDIALQGAKGVYCVDMNPAQSYLLELKKESIRRLGYEDGWRLWGEGRHPNIDRIYNVDLAPFLSEGCNDFWSRRLHYFKRGIYYYGGMGNLIWFLSYFVRLLGLSKTVRDLTEAPTLERQREVYNKSWLTTFVHEAPRLLFAWVYYLWGLFMMNRFVMWLCAGVPSQQLKLIAKDGFHICDYTYRAINGVALHSHLASDNYFYLVCLKGCFTRQCCPRFLRKDEWMRLKSGLVENVHIMTTTFLNALRQRKYSKVILMDHVDWLTGESIDELAAALKAQVVPGGRIIWRSASLTPPYAEAFAKNGFKVECVRRNDCSGEDLIDRVNMYASFWVGVRED